ncbi:Tectonic-3 [Sciurus carolinensis]|uniref:Tectonic-3 n=1 Tax=Sciurus carolinensis TaxID=30640 RepID=A0AA41N6U5_SCICA|nr:Tectonic-3 [Sciurus carolinensis]
MRRLHSALVFEVFCVSQLATDRMESEQLAERVMVAVIRSLSDYPFNFQGATIISGEEEGAYGWITINYLLGNFIQKSKWLKEVSEGINHKKTFGALDLGGASTQIAFVNEKYTLASPENFLSFRLYGKHYDVYTHSFLCYGKDQALWQKLAKDIQASVSSDGTLSDPCFHSGYEKVVNVSDLYKTPCTKRFERTLPFDQFKIQGTGNYEQCQQSILELFNTSYCPYSQCAFNGIFLPPLQGSFGAFSAFYFVMDFLNLTSEKVSQEEAIRRIGNFCSQPWKVVETSFPEVDKKQLSEYCFSSTYIFSLLLHGYHFTSNSWENIYFMGKFLMLPVFVLMLPKGARPQSSFFPSGAVPTPSVLGPVTPDETPQSSSVETATPQDVPGIFTVDPTPLTPSMPGNKTTDLFPGFLESKSTTCTRFFKNLASSCTLDPALDAASYYNFTVLKFQVPVTLVSQASPPLLVGNTCQNAVSQVIYDIETNGTFGIQKVSVSFGQTSLTVKPDISLQQEFIIHFRMTLLQSQGYGTCSVKRHEVQFGVNAISGCKFRLMEADCSRLQQEIYQTLHGKPTPEHVAIFGNADPAQKGGWTRILNRSCNVLAMNCTSCCFIPVSLEIQVLWAYVGLQSNPQAQVSGTRFLYQCKTIQDYQQVTEVHLTTLVNFVDITQKPEPPRGQPKIDWKLPFDFFFPFKVAFSRGVDSQKGSVSPILILCLFLLGVFNLETM